MIFKKFIIAAALAGAIITAPIAAAITSPAAFAEQHQAKGTVYILATGGTIAGAGKSATQTTGYKAGALGVQTLIDAVPQMKDYAKIEGEQISNIGSQDMTTDILLKHAKRINELLKRDDVTDIVITHGTDTLEETAYFLNLVVKSDKPVVVVGAMRPATAISTDGPMNLLDAVRVATDPESKGRGVLVSLNDTINTARANTKTNTAPLQTFASPEVGAIGIITGGKVRYYRQVEREHTTRTPFNVSKLDKLPRVDIIYTHVSDDGVMADAAVAAGAKGIVSAGSGMGSIHKDTNSALERAVRKGVIVVRSSRTGSGFVDAADEWKDYVTADNLNPQKARILLQLALTRTSDNAEIQKMFDKY